MNSKNTDYINKLLESSQEDHLIIDEMNHRLSKMEWSDQLNLHSHLSMKALIKIYSLVDKLVIGLDAKEHIIWYYFKKVYLELDTSINMNLLEELLNDYIKYKFIALENIIIDLIKKENLTLYQIENIEKVFTDKAVLKQTYIYKIKILIQLGNILEQSQVLELIQIEAFDLLYYALKRNQIDMNAFNIFRAPNAREKYRKLKMLIYEEIQKKLLG